MTQKSTQQEILIPIGTSFASRKYNKTREDISDDNISDNEQLQEAFWNGLLNDLLPEICQLTTHNKKLFIWQVTEADEFIELELGEQPEERDKEHSINPYLFMEIYNEN